MLRFIQRAIGRLAKHEWLIFLCVTVLWLKLVTGFDILLPSHNSSLLNNGDLEQHYLGWEFLRQEAFYLFPFGKVVNLGSGAIPSIVYTDSIPLIAIPLNGLLKLLDNLFGVTFESFQFTGWWIAICIYLQYSGSFYCLKKLGVRPIASYAYGVLFIISPILLWRLPGIHGHISLLSQWLILWSFYLYISRSKGIYWLVLLAISLAIHAYCGAMVLMVSLCHLIDMLNSSVPKHRVVRLAVSTAVITALTLSLLGYFEISGSIENGGYGTYKWNTLSWLNGASGFSQIFHFWDYNNGEYEGFSYLGISIIFLLVSGLVVKTFRAEFIRLLRSYRLLVIGCLVMCMFAMTLSIGIGTIQIPIAGLPPPFRELGNIFRASGRFSWPMMYLVMLFAVSSWDVAAERLLIDKSRLHVSMYLSGFVLALAFVQIADSSEALIRIKNATGNSSHISVAQEYRSDSLKDFRSIILYPSDNYYPGWHLWWRIALANSLEVNSGSFARYDRIIAKKLDKDVESMLTRKRIGEKSLLITISAKAKSQITEDFEPCEEFEASNTGQDCYVNLDKGAIAVGAIGEALEEYLKRVN